MTVRVWGNQHGHGVVLDGEHLEFAERMAAEWGVSLESAVEQIILSGLGLLKEKHE